MCLQQAIRLANTMRTLMKSYRFAISWSNQLRLMLRCAVLAIIAVQIAVPPRVAACDLCSDYQRSGEDSEPAEESESDGEEPLFEFRDSDKLRQSRSNLDQTYLGKRTSPKAYCRRPAPSDCGE